jgi:hypothetical protein
MTERTFTVPGWLARYQVKQHLDLFGIEYSEDRRDRESVFTVEATDEQWVEINRAVEQAGI